MYLVVHQTTLLVSIDAVNVPLLVVPTVNATLHTVIYAVGPIYGMKMTMARIVRHHVLMDCTRALHTTAHVCVILQCYHLIGCNLANNCTSCNNLNGNCTACPPGLEALGDGCTPCKGIYPVSMCCGCRFFVGDDRDSDD